MTAGGYLLSCRLTSAPLWLGIYLFLWWFLLVIFELFLLHWGYELPCQDKLPEFHSAPILGCIRILWLVSHPLGLGLDKALCGWNSVTNHGIVNLIMNEYACYGKGHTIHPSGQIEWFKNSVDDRSVQVGGKQRICTIDGYAMPLTCRGGLMYLSVIGKPTDNDLERYQAVHLTGPHEWDPSVLDYTHPSGDEEPPWSNDPGERFTFDPNFDEFQDYTQRAIQTLRILDDSSSTLTPCSTLMTNQHVFRTYQHDVSHETSDYENFRPYFGWVKLDTVQKTMEQSTQWGVSLPNTFPMKKHLKSRNPVLNIPRRHEAVATVTEF